MAKLPSFRRIFIGDFSPEEQPLVNKLAATINQGLEVVYSVLNNNISISDNMAATVKEIQVRVDAAGNPIGTTGFPLTFKGNAKGILVLRAENLSDTSTYPTSQPFCSFTQAGPTLFISHISGLQANQNYRLTLVAFA